MRAPEAVTSIEHPQAAMGHAAVMGPCGGAIRHHDRGPEVRPSFRTLRVVDGSAYWDEEASSFDQEPDHGLRHPEQRQAWDALLAGLVPERPVRIADLGCGTGSLSVLAAQQGHVVTGVDFSSKMIERSREKALAASVLVDFLVADVSEPPLRVHSFDVVLARHVLWALPDPGVGVGRWIDLLDAEGRLLLFEGSWSSGVGLTADETLALVRAHGRDAHVIRLPDAIYWGREITDERYVVVSSPW